MTPRAAETLLPKRAATRVRALRVNAYDVRNALGAPGAVLDREHAVARRPSGDSRLLISTLAIALTPIPSSCAQCSLCPHL